ncbi:metalloregulator ArsR/SmtB family transcription factor [Methanonatronarchaeum sp. AMET6-2]|uniref:ArsR/SmtB family transcription factor n=1 Tax=Methanonatronarchaeum sp. AMET6-2 TaxID=2933293 RepID=UPI0012247F9A|nr:metalloregulator ArsR/SmtB family transcription factor [Methanonatronarchaeum sp. AMET6-2]RZN60840.1 MAG: ArsR family transcriptional regulator [Methanonatronarchaeia archaeon]UOY09536.1 metalloregulator ArsR/SmtB family transcription factor [Methanonatronarchaeum sp. AMET6-2]
MQELFKALGSEHRITLLEALLKEDDYICICELEDLIDRDRSVVYRHFKKLEEANLIKTRRKGKRLECKVKHPDKTKKLLETAKKLE